MTDRSKPPTHGGMRREMPMASDSPGFSIESTTLRLRAVRLQRVESEKKLLAPTASSTPKSAKASAEMPRSGPSGRVRHDERGQAVWDWAVATGEFATLSTTLALKKLEMPELEIQESKPTELKLEVSGRDKAGGGDPYNQRGSGKRPEAAAVRQGVTGAADRQAVLEQLLGKKG